MRRLFVFPLVLLRVTANYHGQKRENCNIRGSKELRGLKEAAGGLEPTNARTMHDKLAFSMPDLVEFAFLDCHAVLVPLLHNVYPHSPLLCSVHMIRELGGRLQCT